MDGTILCPTILLQFLILLHWSDDKDIVFSRTIVTPLHITPNVKGIIDLPHPVGWTSKTGWFGIFLQSINRSLDITVDWMGLGDGIFQNVDIASLMMVLNSVWMEYCWLMMFTNGRLVVMVGSNKRCIRLKLCSGSESDIRITENQWRDISVNMMAPETQPRSISLPKSTWERIL